MRRGWILALGILVALAACTAGPRVDTRYEAVSQDSRVQFIIIHYTQIDFEHSLQRLTREEVSSHYLVNRDAPGSTDSFPKSGGLGTPVQAIGRESPRSC